ncbi:MULTISPECIES: helix-turn-helix domain-containing protein [unclassified Butyrivibrio]|uniref:helix-turn-helix domain-containing protein n=1 Tax=unclassified Butyrivibrio TaxID=2639466 RepID=UPI00047DC88D|nr:MULTISPECIES: helix-turn-helix transcriptional regulator [unclassified Butyrivibrio]
MTISERLFKLMEDKNISIPELSRMTGISRHTIFDWHKKNTNPGADKIMIICEALQISPVELLIGKENLEVTQEDISSGDIETQIISEFRKLSDSKKKRLLAYISMLMNMKE